MSTSQAFIASSPLSAASALGGRRKSKFVFKHLAQLSQYNTSCPLRVIAHVDLDAFYAVSRYQGHKGSSLIRPDSNVR
jgi:DNA polymerase eta